MHVGVDDGRTKHCFVIRLFVIGRNAASLLIIIVNMKKVLFLLLVCLSMKKLAAQELIPLYMEIPNSKPIANREKSEVGKDGILRISKVSEPALLVFLPPKEKSNGTAVIICPGGGYGILAASHEGTDVAKVFNEWGVAAFVLKYRLPDDSIMIDKTIGPLQDAQ